MVRLARVVIDRQIDDNSLFTVIIFIKSQNGASDEVAATYTDLSGLSGVFAQLSQWAEIFTATGGQHLWTFLDGECKLRFEFT